MMRPDEVIDRHSTDRVIVRACMRNRAAVVSVRVSRSLQVLPQPRSVLRPPVLPGSTLR